MGDTLELERPERSAYAKDDHRLLTTFQSAGSKKKREDAFAQLLKKYQGKLRFLARSFYDSLGKDFDNAYQIAQIGFWKACEDYDAARCTGEPGSWLYYGAKMRLVDEYARRQAKCHGYTSTHVPMWIEGDSAELLLTDPSLHVPDLELQRAEAKHDANVWLREHRDYFSPLELLALKGYCEGLSSSEMAHRYSHVGRPAYVVSTKKEKPKITVKAMDNALSRLRRKLRILTNNPDLTLGKPNDRR